MIWKKLALAAMALIGAIFVMGGVQSIPYRPNESGGAGAKTAAAGIAGGVAAFTGSGGGAQTIITGAPDASSPNEFLPPADKPAALTKGTLITHGSRTTREIALTFDACEVVSAGYDGRVINDLMQARAPATLFLGGKWMLDHPAATRELAQVPFFELANHSYDHPHFSRLTPEEIRQQVVMTQDIMYDLTGRRGRLFRFPFGEWNSAAIAEVSALGLQTIQWDVVSGDPSPRQTGSLIIATVLRQAQNGSIVVMHMNGRGWHTADALPTIIYEMRSRGFALVTVSQLLADSQTPKGALGDDGATSNDARQVGSEVEE